MMTKSTNAIPTERIQLSNQRDSLDWRRSGGRTVTGVECAPEPVNGAPKSCMPLTLAMGGGRRNGDRPSARPTPSPNPGSELRRGVGVRDARGETRGPALALDA